MVRRSTRRLTTTFLVVFSLLFSQLALAAYVCPQAADVAAMAAMMEAGVPCEGMDPQQPALCHQHSADPSEAFQAIKLPTASLPAIVRTLELPPAPDEGTARAIAWAATPEVKPPRSPLFLSTLRLRV